MKRISLYILSALAAVTCVSCSVRTHEVIADHARSGDAILLPLETPGLCKVKDTWYMKGYKSQVERRNTPCIQKTKVDKEHPERYQLVNGLQDSEIRYAEVPEEMAQNLLKGQYSHSDAISFINRKWVRTLPEGEVKQVSTKAQAPAFFRNMSSHRLLKDGSNSYLLARVGEMTADFSAVYMYPLAGVSALLIDLPGSIILGPQSSSKPVQTAQPEELQ